MQQVFTNLFQSKARLMVILRYLLLGAIAFMGAERLRLMLINLQATETYNNRDFLQYYLISKAAIAGQNPYLPLDELARIFIGNIPFFPHPAPCPPFLAILFIPFSSLNINQFGTTVFIFELILLLLIAYLLPKIWNEKASLSISAIALIILLAWYPVANDLSYGQLSILLTVLLLSALLALRKRHNIQAGVFIGLTVAIKLITWPIIIYFAIKRDWKALISSLLTVIGANLLAALVIGVGPFVYYYLQASSQVFSAYQAVLHNFSIWSIGYRLFDGTGSKVFVNFISAPPLVYIPQIAFIFSGLLAISYLVWGLVHASRAINLDTAVAILVCVILCISPVTWAHYYVMLVIPLLILYRLLWERNFPPGKTSVFLAIVLLLFLVNEQLVNIILSINKISPVNTNQTQITFASSLIALLPILEVIALSGLLWQGKAPDNGRHSQLIAEK
jgi:hypothetical protein